MPRKNSIGNGYYTYLYFDLNGCPRYVGKGKGKRSDAHNLKQSHNKQLQGMAKAAGGNLPVVIIRDGMTESEAFSLEVAFIAAIGRLDQGKGPLLNHTDGGDGVSGYKHTPEQRAANGARHKLRPPMPEAVRKQLSLALSGKPKTAEHNKAVSAAKKGKPGKIPSAATRVKMSLAQKGKKRCNLPWWHTSGGVHYRANHPRNPDDIKGRRPSTIAMVSKALTGRKLSEAHKAAVSLGQNNMSAVSKKAKSEKLRAAHSGRRLPQTQKDKIGATHSELVWWCMPDGKTYKSRQKRNVNDVRGRKRSRDELARVRAA